jgi:chemotaxis receptor (MCP) glutamine deamidase CheD
MPDDPSKRGGQDRKRIDVSQKHELRAWSKKFGVTPDALKKAVASAGTQADKVEAKLRGGGKAPDRKPMKRAGDR